MQHRSDRTRIPVTAAAFVLAACSAAYAHAEPSVAAFAGGYVCRYESHHMAQPRAFGTLAIAPDGAYMQTDLNGTTIATGKITSLATSRATGTNVRFSGDLPPMHASFFPTTLTANYNRMSKLICTHR